MSKPKSGSKSKDKPASAKPASMTDISHPDTSKPSDTSKPIITHRPMIKDPMMVDEDKKPEQKTDTLQVKKAGETKLTPLDEKADDKSDDEPDEDKPAEPDEPATGDEPEDSPDKSDKSAKSGKPADDKPDKSGDDEAESSEAEDGEGQDDQEQKDGEEPGGDGDDGKKTKDTKPKPKSGAEAEEDPKIRKLIESKKYFLPINAVERRRSARFAAIGVLLALILAAAWLDVALDAGLIHLGGVQPVTHLFSN